MTLKQAEFFPIYSDPIVAITLQIFDKSVYTLICFVCIL